MEHTGLPLDWAFRPALDLELKQYTLLAYLQRVQGRFREHKLYPHLLELRAHLDTLTELRRRKEALAGEMGGGLLGFDPHTGNALHERPVDDAHLGVIDAVIDFALPGLRRMWTEGSDLRQDLAGRIRLIPVGLQPLNPAEGWLLLRQQREARVYAYTIPLVHPAAITSGHQHVITRFVATYTLGISCTYEHIRTELHSARGAPAVPATYAFEAEGDLPHIETFMPLAKELVRAHIAATWGASTGTPHGRVEPHA